jgi:hypothetical protein
MTYTVTPLNEHEICQVHELCDDETGDIMVIVEYIDGDLQAYLDKLSDDED